MEVVHPQVAGIDVHKKVIWVAVRLPGEGPGQRALTVRRFKTFWRSLQKMAAWLAELGVTDAALESTERVTPHVLRHFCASQLYLGGMDLVAIQETLGHAWVATTMNYIHVHATHVEDAWIAGQQRAAGRLKGLGP